MNRYLLDTNTVSHALKGHPKVISRITSKPMGSLVVSVITEAEIRYCLAKRPEALRLHELVAEFLLRVVLVPWDSRCADGYGELRAGLEASGTTLAPLDLLIGAHAQALGAVLVSSDQAFRHCHGLAWEDWVV